MKTRGFYYFVDLRSGNYSVYDGSLSIEDLKYYVVKTVKKDGGDSPKIPYKQATLTCLGSVSGRNFLVSDVIIDRVSHSFQEEELDSLDLPLDKLVIVELSEVELI